jgi:hypothetical protein
VIRSCLAGRARERDGGPLDCRAVNARWTAASIAIGIALGGCGDEESGGDDDSGEAPAQLAPAQIDKIENALESALASPGSFDEPGAEVQAVECPSDIEQKSGEEFQCEVRRSDGEGVATVTLVDERGTDIAYEADIAGARITGRQDIRD